MRKFCVFTLVVLAVLGAASSLVASNTWAELHPTNYVINADNSTLTVTRTEISADKCVWTYVLNYQSSSSIAKLTSFDISVLTNDTNEEGDGDLYSGHFKDYYSSLVKAKPVEFEGNLYWSNFKLLNGTSATFSFTTDLMDWTFSNVVANGANTPDCSPSWTNVPIPSAETPEPGGLLALFCGCVGLFANVRRLKAND